MIWLVLMGCVVAFTPFMSWAVAKGETVPQAGSPYCLLKGQVVSLLTGVGRNAAGEALSVPVALVRVESNMPIDPANRTGFCEKMVGRGANGAAPQVHFRVCDTNAEFFTSDRIRAVAGRNMGGGYYCIDQITRSLD